MTPFDLKGKAALVTGGNGGIGLGMAKGLAQAGASIAVAGRDDKKNASAIAALKSLGVTAIAVKVDLQDENSTRAMVEEAAQKLGRLDILVYNAGISIRTAPQEYTLAVWTLVMDIKLICAFYMKNAE